MGRERRRRRRTTGLVVMLAMVATLLPTSLATAVAAPSADTMVSVAPSVGDDGFRCKARINADKLKVKVKEPADNAKRYPVWIVDEDRDYDYIGKTKTKKFISQIPEGKYEVLMRVVYKNGEKSDFVSCGFVTSMPNPDQCVDADDIVDVAAAAGFETLLAAVGAAGLEDALRGEGPLTVFAPTDAAFAKLGDGVIKDLLDNPDVLANILLYHVAAGHFTSNEVIQRDNLGMLNGDPAFFTPDGGDLLVNNATIEAVDVAACNGVIHVIDTVILPPAQPLTAPHCDVQLDGDDLTVTIDGSDEAARFPVWAVYHNHYTYLGSTSGDTFARTVPQGDWTIETRAVFADGTKSDFADCGDISVPGDIVDVAEAAGFTTLLAAVEAAGLEDVLRSEGPFTVFAPTNEAFAALGDETIKELLNNPDVLADILLYHVVLAEVPSSVAVGLTEATMANGDKVMIELRDGDLFINDSKVVVTDVPASNGVIHVIDAVLLPPA